MRSGGLWLSVALIVFGAVSCLWWFGVFGGRGMPTIDLQSVAPNATIPVGAAAADRPELRVAVAAMISPEPTKKYYDALLRLIGQRVGREVVFVQRPTYAEVNALLAERKIDVAFVCSGPYVTGREEFGMELLAVPVVGGEAVYRCYFIAHRDSDVESLDDLRGKRFALTDRLSNTGYLVPRYVLGRRGQTLESFFGETFFTRGHDNSIRAVAEGLADGAAVDQLVWDFLDAGDSVHTRRTKIVGRSPDYGIPPVVVHPELESDLKRRLREVFLSLHEEETSRDLLRRLRIDRFVEGDDAAYDSVRRMQLWLADTKEEGR